MYVAKNKGADELRRHREADLRLCFRIYAKLLFSHDAAQMIFRSAKNVGRQSLYGIHIWDLLGITVVHTFYDLCPAGIDVTPIHIFDTET